MADTPLFTLDAGGRYRLGYDANQWVIQRREKNPSARRIEGRATRDSGFRGVWHVGSEKRTLLQYIAGERGPPLPEKKRPRIHLTPAAQFRLDALSDTFREFQSMAVESTAA